ncbi:MAG: hypothetical protein IKD77_01480 [Bacilli bacterium]|nr:hypothetical protein [Bacilli bacterium]
MSKKNKKRAIVYSNVDKEADFESANNSNEELNWENEIIIGLENHNKKVNKNYEAKHKKANHSKNENTEKATSTNKKTEGKKVYMVNINPQRNGKKCKKKTDTSRKNKNAKTKSYKKNECHFFATRTSYRSNHICFFIANI